MKRFPIFSIVLLAALLLAGCSKGNIITPGLPPTAAPTSPPAQTPTTAPGAAGGPTQPARNSQAASVFAQLAIARQLVITTDEIKFVSSEDVKWPNACLGAPKQGETCAEVVTNGYKFIFTVKDKTYEVHTNGNGSQLRIVGDTEGPKSASPTASADQPTAVVNAQKMLAQQLNVAVDQISLVKAEAIDWPNGCLGVQMPGKMCTSVITPGYRVVFSSGGKQYEFHTDQAGGAIFSAVAPLPETAGKVLVWEQTEGAVCSRVEVGATSVAYGTCGGQLKEGKLDRADELAYLYASYAPFNGTTKAGTVQFNGQGQTQPTPAEMRSVAEWAKLVFMEAEGGRSGAAWGAAFGWHREGGIAGFCNDMAIYLNGWAWPSSCKSGEASQLNHYRLTADELEQMYKWVDQFKTSDLEQKDSATADSMKITLAVYGQGTAEPTSADKDAMLNFMGTLYSKAVR